MKKTTILLIAILFLVVGYAAYSITIDIYGNGKIAENISDFKVYLSNLKLNDNEIDGINSTKDEFTIDDIDGTVEVDIVNDSTEYDTEAYLECETQSEENKIWNYEYTGSAQDFTTTTDGIYKIEVWGAQGGSYDTTYIGGNGAYASGEIRLKKNKNLYVYVGQENGCVEGASGFTTGGYNGGGYAGHTGWNNRYFCGGGGATDVRLINGVWNNIDSLKSRIIVAAGGGGANYYSPGYHAIGGSGGGLIGYKSSGNTGSKGDGVAKGNAGTQFNGSGFGVGKGQTTSGGGGGYFGGDVVTWDGGTGGSSFISGHAGSVAILESSTEDSIVFKNDSNGISCSSENSLGYNVLGYNTDYECSQHYSGYVFHNTKMIDGNGYTWTSEKGDYIGQIQPDGEVLNGHLNDGYARITLLSSFNNKDTEKVTISAQDSSKISIEDVSGKSLTCKLKVNKISRAEKKTYNGPTEWTFDYTGAEQTFTVPVSGLYRIETWGAQGGNYDTVKVGGYGGYSVGEIKLNVKNTLYINIGGKGTGDGTHTPQTGGYNGGGNANSDSDGHTRQSSGGGATHVSFSSGLLKDLYPYTKNDIIIVSGGGAGSAANSEIMSVTGGSAGGYKGNNGEKYQESENLYGTGYGGNQIESPLPEYGSALVKPYYSIGGAGYGADGIYAGGGGGYFGGSTSVASAGGGSSYIGNALLTNKAMYCYNCTESNEESIKTVSTTCTNATPTENCSKQGNGYARIILVSIN